jgi:phosphoribosylformylglycinamidine cyclo-ligase
MLDGVGGFAAGFDFSIYNYKDPILVSGTDGVGTKLKMALLTGRHREVGVDLVAMSVNDVLVCGAKPLFFLDYFATGKLMVERGLEVIEGVAQGCVQAGCALIGGETAEMPGMYHGDDYDLAGFCVGIVERGDQRGSHRVEVGDVIVGLSSSGPHSNGFSLIRKLVTEPDGESLRKNLFQNGSSHYLEQLMEPTRIYVKPVLNALTQIDIHAMAHITGGGFFENIPRSLKTGQYARIERRLLAIPPVFSWLVGLAKMDDTEPFHVWNMGTGFVVIVDAKDADLTVNHFQSHDVPASIIGRVERGDGEPHVQLV